MSGGPSSLLFVCGENALRSPMAEGMVKKKAGNRVFVDSVGLREGTLDNFAVEVMAEIGIDITSHRPKLFDDLADMSFDVIVTLSPEAHHHAREMTRLEAVEVAFWPIYDPSMVEGNREARLAAYREVRDTLASMIDALLLAADEES
jgi:protein-tyrosine-phosphatase